MNRALRPGWGLLAVCAPFFFSACEAPPPVEAGRAAITNGTDDDGDPAVVGLSLTGGPVYCTGTLITPRSVLTAGHCTQAAVGQPIEIYFGSIPSENGERIPVADVRPHPFYDRVGLKNDLAIVTLERDAPVDPVLISSRPFDDTFLGQPLKVVGFGSTGQGMASVTQRKRQGIGRVLDFEAQKFRFNPDPGQTCEGDSGGPGFMQLDGAWALVGVTSSGDSACMEFGRDVRVDAYLDEFILPLLANGGGEAPLGARCESSLECGSNLCAREPTRDAGITTCLTRCASDAPCGPSSTCKGLFGDGGVGACFRDPPDACAITPGRHPAGGACLLFALLGLAGLRRRAARSRSARSP